MTLYQTAARAWCTLAGLSLLLPSSARLGVWLPLHLVLAGAASVAIAGAMQTFAVALTATGSPPGRWVWGQFVAMNTGVALIALGRPLTLPALVAVGGIAFVAGATILLWFVLRAWRASLHERHRLPLRMYAFAVTCVLVGGTFGALLGSGTVHDATTYLALRHAHMTINVLGWVSVTIAATLITLLPTILRVKMPSWHGGLTGRIVGRGRGDARDRPGDPDDGRHGRRRPLRADRRARPRVDGVPGAQDTPASAGARLCPAPGRRRRLVRDRVRGARGQRVTRMEGFDAFSPGFPGDVRRRMDRAGVARRVVVPPAERTPRSPGRASRRLGRDRVRCVGTARRLERRGRRY